jgi:branched-chain amino acid transport system ATP-binding protein
MSEPVLRVTDLWAGYGDAPVIRGLSFTVGQGEAAVIIGPNGHGKTTLLRAISGLVRPSAGTVELGGESVQGWTPEHIARLGLAHVPQGDGLFDQMSVEENLLMGAFPRASWRARRQALERVYAMFPGIGALAGQRARTLSGGERRLTALGRALMRSSRIMLIDEPSLGLAPVAIDTVYGAIAELKAAQTTLLLVEENFTHVADIADEMHVVESGQIVRSGSYGALASDPAVVTAYLGGL